jgi:hypothetical protein
MAGSWGELENLTLSDAELAQCEPIGDERKMQRAYCPFHGSDRQRSLRVNRETGRFNCFSCGAWGYLDDARERQRSESATLRVGTHRHPPQRAYRPKPEPETKPELTTLMASYRAALPGSPGEAYLRERHIPLQLAQAVGVGFAAPGTWLNASRDWKGGRVVFPHTTPSGDVVNLYGRAVGDAPKSLKHDHLSGAKGYFHAQALADGSGPATICEGAFDALALMAAGAPNVVAIFGVNGWRWEWATKTSELILALDADDAGATELRELAREARLRGKGVAYLEPGAYGGEKDASAAWQAGSLKLGNWEPFFHHDGDKATPEHSASPQETQDEPASAPTPSGSPMAWSDALERCERLHVADKLDAYSMSYGYLDGGPAWLSGLASELHEEVARLDAEDELPAPLAKMCFAWKNATYMARHRSPSELPESWRKSDALEEDEAPSQPDVPLEARECTPCGYMGRSRRRTGRRLRRKEKGVRECLDVPGCLGF